MPIFPSSSALYYGLLTGCGLLGLGLMALAWHRPRSRQRPLRMLAGAVAAGALWLVAFPPLRLRPAARAEAILLTENYSPDTLRQLLRQLGTGTPVWAYGHVEKPPKARPLASLLALAEQRPTLRRLHVLGRGLPAADLPILGPMAVRQHPGTPETGFATAYWPTRLPLGEVLEVEGRATLPNDAGPARVVLRAAGAGRDSVELPASGAGTFRLRYQPKTAGLAVYELLLRQPGQPPRSEPVPVEVTVPPVPAVLLLAAAPSFEFKFLRNYLAEANYPVALRTGVSRGLVQTDFVNQPRLNLDRLAPALLARYQLVVADAASVAALTGAETQALQAAVRTGRLGLVVLAEAAPLPRNTPARADFTVQPRPAAPATLPALAWPNAPGDARAPLPAQLQARPELRPLVTGPQQLLAAASRHLGLGAVVVSTVAETFRWGLQGHAAVYASYWNRLLQAAVPPAPVAARWQLATRWPRPGQPLGLQLAAGTMPGASPTVAALAGGPAVRLALRQDTRLPEWHSAPFWPGAAGWHRVLGPGTTRYHFYVYPAAAWAGPEGQARQQAAARVSATTTGMGVAAPADTALEPWPAGWFFGLFLLAAGYLWVEEKL